MSSKNMIWCLAVSVAFAASVAFAEKNWPTSGTATIPSGECWTIENGDVANVAGLSEIAFADATASVKYTASTELALSAKLSGTGSFIASGGNKVVFSGDSRDFEGVIAITNTIADMASRYGLGSVKSRVILHQDTAGDRFFVSATGADCLIDTPILFSGGIKFGPSNAADTLVISNDLMEVAGGATPTTIFYVKGNVHMVAGQFGTKKNHMYPYITNKMTLAVDGDVAVNIDGGLYCMFSGANARFLYGVTNEVKLTNVYIYSADGSAVLTQPNVRKAKGGMWGSNAGTPPKGWLDLNGCDQEFKGLNHVNATPTEDNDMYAVIKSERPATLTLNDSSAASYTAAYMFSGDVSLNCIGKATTTFVHGASDSTGELRVGDHATVVMKWRAAWAGTNVVVEGNGKLDCQCTSAITKGVASLEIKDSGVLNVAEGVELVVCSLTIDGTTLPDDHVYTVADLTSKGYGAFVTGAGSIRVEEYVPAWTGWPTTPGQRVIVPPSTNVNVDSSDDLSKAMACREISLKGGSVVNFNAPTDGLVVTNTFSGYGTVTFKNTTLLYMASDASGMLDPGHLSFDLCDTVIVSNEVAIGGLRSGACTFNSDNKLRRKLLFAGEGDVVNQAAVLYEDSFLFGALSDTARLYQTNSFLSPCLTAEQWDWVYITNKVTFCNGTFGTKDGGTAFYCGYKTSDIVLTSNTVFRSTGATFIYDRGTWHLGSRQNALGDLHPGLTDLTLVCDCTNAFGSTKLFQPYNASGSPTGCLDLNGFNQEAPYFTCQNANWGETTEWRAYIRSATPAYLASTAVNATPATRARINYWFEGQASFWLKGNDNMTISRTQSTSTGELRISGGSLTLDWASSWAGSVVVDGGKLIVDATAGGKYLDQEKYEDMPVFSRKLNLVLTDGGKLSLGKDVKVRSVRTGEKTFLAPGEWGSSASGAKNVNDTLFEGTGKVTVRYGTDGPVGMAVIVR